MTCRLLIALALLAMSGAAAAHDIRSLDPPDSANPFIAAFPGEPPHVLMDSGAFAAIALQAGAPVLEAPIMPAQPAPPAGITILPDGMPGLGENDIRSAWLADPTDRYDHGVLGDAIEAATLVVEARDGRLTRFVLPPEAVFEDLTPRVVDLDGDGRDEVLIIKATQSAGASLVVLGLSGNALAVKAESPPIGRRNRWLNPVGTADFTGDGVREIALIETPHIGGRLKLFAYRAGSPLRLLAETGGVSNHAIGARELGLSAIGDFDADGTPDILVPDQSRHDLVAVRWQDDELTIAGRIDLPSPPASDFLSFPADRAIAFIGRDGRLYAIRPFF